MLNNKILLLDKNHKLISDQLLQNGFVIEEDYYSSYFEVLSKIHLYCGIIIRSRIPIDAKILETGKNLRFVARVGAGMENIDIQKAKELGIECINSPEGNRDAVAEHVIAMLLAMMDRLFVSSAEVKKGIWLREENRGDELLGKTFGIIGYGNMGKAVAKRLSGFGVDVIFHDVLSNLEDKYAKQVSIEDLQKYSDIISLHTPQSPETKYIINENFIQNMSKKFYLINTARGMNVKTSALVEGLKSGKIISACLDVLEFEKSSFEGVQINKNPDMEYLLNSERVLLTPHIAGWTTQSKVKLAQVIVDKILDFTKFRA